MEMKQAVEEVIKLKKQYNPQGDQNVMMNNKGLADNVRNDYGVDNSRYGADVTLAQAYKNYMEDFGESSGGGQPQQQASSGQESMNNFYQGSSNAFYDNQKSQLDMTLNNQLTELKKSYDNAVYEGKLSVREAEEQFNSQKSEIEKNAYSQNEATKAYTNEMGISNSQQSVGLYQGDNARSNSMHNSNMTTRDKRVNDIRDRINLLTQQKDLDIASANANHGYSLAGAQAQADQMYNENMGNFMQQDYFADKSNQHDKDMFDKSAGHDKDMAQISYDFDIKKLYTGHSLDLEKMDKQLSQNLTAMSKQHGFDMSMLNAKTQAELKSMREQASLSSKSVSDEYEVAKRREALRLGLSPDATEYQIAQKQKANGEAEMIWEMEAKSNQAIKDIIKESTVMTEALVLQDPALSYNGSAPKDVSSDWGMVGNFLTGYNSKNKAHDKATQDKINALEAVIRFKRQYGQDTSAEEAQLGKFN